ncbi:MAG: phosphonate ABC transporter, permease protein PhnE [Opitutae bacterium]|nr:phosphonate ABC transporter, permease protein PhnE [Opitutae bacterium]
MEARRPQTKGSRMKPELPWHSRFDLLGITFLLFLIGAFGSLPSIEGSGRDLDYWGNLSRFSSQFFPPDWSILDRTLEGLLETVQIALVSTLLSIVISIVLSICAARTIAPLWLLWPTRMILNVIRTIPSLLWALLAVVIVGSNPLAGVIALTFYSVGYLAKFFSETFEAADTDAQQALRSLGATPLQAFQFGLWPNARPIIWSHCLWMLEYNVRSASIIGYVGAGGIGLHLKLYAESADSWNKFSLVLLCILVIVTVLDFTGEKIRQNIRNKLEGKKSN